MNKCFRLLKLAWGINERRVFRKTPKVFPKALREKCCHSLMQETLEEKQMKGVPWESGVRVSLQASKGNDFERNYKARRRSSSKRKIVIKKVCVCVCVWVT